MLIESEKIVFFLKPSTRKTLRKIQFDNLMGYEDSNFYYMPEEIKGLKMNEFERETQENTNNWETVQS